MRAVAQVSGDGARGQAVLLKTEAGAVIGLTSTGDTRENVLTKTGSGSGWARADGARTLGGSDIEAKGGGEFNSVVAEVAGSTYGQASRRRQEAC